MKLRWAIAAAIFFSILYMLLLASREPVMRHSRYHIGPGFASAAPVRIILLSDLHIAGPDSTPERLERLVRRVDRLQPDLVLLAGDFLSTKMVETARYDPAAAVAPLAGLRTRLGVLAVLGNHDHWENADALRQALRRAGVIVLDNDARRFGPLAVGGLDDAFTGHADMARVSRKLGQLGGWPILLSHSPDPFAERPSGIRLMLAGHTHCGQISPPLMGPLATASRYGRRFACGVIREGGGTLIVGAGIGTSILPLRFGVPPDFWVIDIGR
jgi:predicted MPP superfamily phosphohydrolase